jgi:hypothetical protein
MSMNVFSNVYSQDYLGFVNETALDYPKVAKFLDLDKNEISKLAGVSKKSVRFDVKIPKEVRERLEEIANICQLVATYFEGDAHKTALWFKAINPLLGNVSPRDMIRLGRYKKLLQFVMSALEDQQAGAKVQKTAKK